MIENTRDLVARMRGSAMAADTFAIALGIGIAQALTFAATPLLARLFQPEQFGQLAIYMSLVSILTAAAAGRYEFAIPMARDAREAAALVRLASIIVLVSTVVMTVVFVIREIAIGGELLGLDRSWLYIPLGVAAISAWRILSNYYTWRGDFRWIGCSHIVRAVVMLACQVGLGLSLGLGATSLIVGNIAGQSAAFGMLAVRRRGSRTSRDHEGVSLSELRTVAHRHLDFVRYGSGQATLNAVSQNATIVVMAHFFANGIVGLISLAIRILMLPVNLIANALRQVIYHRLARATTARERYGLWKRSTCLLAGGSAVPAGFVLAFGPQVFSLFLGDEWRESGVYARYLVVPIMLALTNPPSVMAIPVLELQRAHLAYEVVLFAGRIGAILVGGLLADAHFAVLAFAAVGVICNGWLIVFVGARLRSARLREIADEKVGERGL